MCARSSAPHAEDQCPAGVLRVSHVCLTCVLPSSYRRPTGVLRVSHQRSTDLPKTVASDVRRRSTFRTHDRMPTTTTTTIQQTSAAPRHSNCREFKS